MGNRFYKGRQKVLNNIYDTKNADSSNRIFQCGQNDVISISTLQGKKERDILQNNTGWGHEIFTITHIF